MEKPTVGQVVLTAFPFSDLTKTKLRPALVVGIAEFNNIVLCQITSKPYSSKIAVRISKNDFSSGGLELTSYVRPDKLFTSDQRLVTKQLGVLTDASLMRVKKQLGDIFEL